MSRYVISLGGNALGNNAEEQKRLLKHVALAIYPLIEMNHDIVIVHGNGPQVGMINLAFQESTSTPLMPFAECGAMSQGYIGYHIQNAIQNIMRERQIKRPISTVVTQVLVDEKDPAFLHPTKPIGSFYSEEDAKKLERDMGYNMVEDAGRGYRRVIASPKPIDVIEKESILTLLNEKQIVIAAGGGGIPVIEKDGKLVGIDAVIDKDFASAKIAEIVGADELIILTAVEHVFINYNTPEQKALTSVTLAELEDYLKGSHFKKGSMLPKIEACMSFVKATGRPAVIAALEKAVEAFKQKSGTVIHP
ncbi:MAG: carbamate kinase [Tenericutes bacterium GWC2_34_14]|nr:MAG: carbamate kinase [Tenericutes bacterium GWA2_35_7]OHE30024.1 MAG: carbamate kinase [Tenericutes bacterium GWC2_34_14]OHE35003.1 MAG: carbamate kinase [Tenericutes bacterium GWE2_34_108]OHE37137.1 MAG: carbamate kinase [Tenericutes bacterium GWF1_35_14]OHE39731.1 MAG: carbamate kinase [Tenericutes bacterium GWF2_35_184]OHE44081.1 MAG: carbamate kinase [Tenericutes bacterium RIFOXYA2_FULL_36_32]OHE44669.1 MAG: carbamate kinase [Tenericutes bacterium RIFOXYA12_FULL_35_10]OHE47493.1 MAG: